MAPQLDATIINGSDGEVALQVRGKIRNVKCRRVEILDDRDGLTAASLVDSNRDALLGSFEVVIDIRVAELAGTRAKSSCDTRIDRCSGHKPLRTATI